MLEQWGEDWTITGADGVVSVVEASRGIYGEGDDLGVGWGNFGS